MAALAQTTLLRGLYEELCMTRGYLEAIAERMGGGMKASQVPTSAWCPPP